MATCIWTNGSGDKSYSTAANWSTGTVPTTSDDVYFTSDYNDDVTGGLNQSGTTIGKFVVDGYTGKLGSKSGYLQIDPGSDVTFSGTGVCYLDLGNANVTVTVNQTTGASAGDAGLYLLDSNLSTLSVTSGLVGVAINAGETSTVGTIKVTGGTVLLGSVTATTVTMTGGSVETSSSVTTLNIYAGTYTTSDAAAITTLNGDGGTVVHSASGTITTANVRGVYLDLSQSMVARTITTLAPSGGGSIQYDPNFITISARSALTKPVTESWTDAF
jgi:hypothetical protein